MPPTSPSGPTGSRTAGPPVAASDPRSPSAALLSVVIPTYNRAEPCARAVRSVIAQTYRPIEVVVVDDGSTDDTAERLLAEFGDRITLVRQPNQGVSRARNAGVRASRGACIAFLDSDDTWVAQKAAIQMQWLAERPDFGLCLCDVMLFDTGGGPPVRSHRRAQLPVDGFILDHVLRRPSLLPSTMVVRRDLFEEVGGFDETLRTAEDLDLHLKLALRTAIGLVTEPLVNRTVGDADALSELPQTNQDFVAVVRRFVHLHREVLGPARVRAGLYEALCMNARSAMLSGRTGEGLRYAAEALRHAGGIAQRGAVLGLVSAGLRPLAARFVKGLLPGAGRPRT